MLNIDNEEDETNEPLQIESVSVFNILNYVKYTILNYLIINFTF